MSNKPYFERLAAGLTFASILAACDSSHLPDPSGAGGAGTSSSSSFGGQTNNCPSPIVAKSLQEVQIACDTLAQSPNCFGNPVPMTCGKEGDPYKLFYPNCEDFATRADVKALFEPSDTGEDPKGECVVGALIPGYIEPIDASFIDETPDGFGPSDPIDMEDAGEQDASGKGGDGGAPK